VRQVALTCRSHVLSRLQGSFTEFLGCRDASGPLSGRTWLLPGAHLQGSGMLSGLMLPLHRSLITRSGDLIRANGTTRVSAALVPYTHGTTQHFNNCRLAPETLYKCPNGSSHSRIDTTDSCVNRRTAGNYGSLSRQSTIRLICDSDEQPRFDKEGQQDSRIRKVVGNASPHISRSNTLIVSQLWWIHCPVKAVFWAPFGVSGKSICLWAVPFANARAGPSGRIALFWTNARTCSGRFSRCASPGIRGSGAVRL
jgi:hypothetical protein